MPNFPFSVDNLQVANVIVIGTAAITAQGANVVLPAGTQIAGGGAISSGVNTQLQRLLWFRD